jgi:hypothetical protein
MHGIFVAAGPAFRSGLVIDRFASVEIYNVLARTLDLTPAPNDGTPASSISSSRRSRVEQDGLLARAGA